MKTSEKLKRIKLISEKLFVENAHKFPQYKTEQIAQLAIKDAHIFVLTFEMFEDKFLSENQDPQ
jgi:hypothetical protein